MWRSRCFGVLWRPAPAQQPPAGSDSTVALSSSAAPLGSMADAGSSGAQQPSALPHDNEGSDNEDNDGPEPVEYSPGGRYGRMDLVLGRGAFKTVRGDPSPHC